MQTRTIPIQRCPGFALPAVILISTGLMILLVTLMTIVELERATSKARVGSYQADLAVESGLEEAKMILAGATSTDTYAIAAIPFAAEFDDNGDGTISSEEDDRLDLDSGERGRPYLYAIQGQVEAGEPSFRLTPLFATHEGPGSERVSIDGQLTLPDDPGLSPTQETNLDNLIALSATSHLQAPVTAWRTIRDQEGTPIARYSYWVEDMQGYIDAELVPGNARQGKHVRANENWANNVNGWNSRLRDEARDYIAEGGQIPLWPAPGINPGYEEEAEGFLNPETRLLNEVATYTLDQSQEGIEDETQMDDVLRSITPQAPTPASLLALNGVEAPLERIAAGPDRGRLELGNATGDVEARWIEENFVSGNRMWEEQALVPFVPGISGQVMGTPRLNLNRLLTEAGRPGFGGLFSPVDGVVVEIGAFIDRALPDFAEMRKGGFPENYSQTLAANMIDYADPDGQPTVKEGSYRGIDSHPLITEYVTTFTWRWVQDEDVDNPLNQYANKSFLRTNGNLYLLMTVEVWAELWNMSNHTVEGEVEFAYENYYEFPALGNPGITFMGDVLENRTGPGTQASFSSHGLEEKEDNFYYSLPRRVRLEPNELLLVPAGEVRYGFYVGGADAFMPQPIPTIDGDEGNSQYRMRWNGQLCDRTMGGLERPAFTRLDTRAPKTKALVCGTWGPYGSFFTGMQDPRQSWWAGINPTFPEGMVSENSYPQNYTPGRRNVRHGSLSGRPQEPYARVLPSEWPDGGHDASFDVRDFRSATSSDRAIRPDDPRFVGSLSAGGRGGMWQSDFEPTKAPMFQSNLGRFISETELGNVFDPIMWKGRRNPGQSTETWPYQELDFAETPHVSARSSEAAHVGGGNTLRIGRPEHEKFEREPGTRASRLLDLFHCGIPLSESPPLQQGALRRIEGHINVNTAPREVLRALVAGILVSDPEIGREVSFDRNNTFAPRHTNLLGEVSATDALDAENGSSDEGGLIADAIIAGRPYVSRSQLADLRFPLDHENNRLRGRPVFGNQFTHSAGTRLQRSDRAAEESFARVYNSSTVRSRNFRIHVIGQALEQTPSGRLNVKSTRKKTYRVFADAGNRNSRTGAIEPGNLKIETLYETNL